MSWFVICSLEPPKHQFNFTQFYFPTRCSYCNKKVCALMFFLKSSIISGWVIDWLPDCLTALQMDRTDSLTDWRTDRVWQTEWMPDRRTELIDWLPDKWTKLIVLLTGLLFDLLTLRSCRFTESLKNWLSLRSTDWLIEGQTDWLIDKSLHLQGDIRLEWLIGDILLTDWIRKAVDLWERWTVWLVKWLADPLTCEMHV